MVRSRAVESALPGPLAVAVAQPFTALGDVAANVARHAEAIRIARARVVVFPELSLTGYCLDAEPIAPDDRRLAPIVDACHESGSVALVGAPVDAGGNRRHIAMLAADPRGVSLVYRKMWLGAEEATAHVAGREPAVIEIDRWRVGLAICRDTRIADHQLATAELGMDLYLAGVCETDDDRAVPARRAERIAGDHGVWVAMASFAGPTGAGFDRTAGRSIICRPDRSVALRLGRRPGRLGVATLTMDPDHR